MKKLLILALLVFLAMPCFALSTTTATAYADETNTVTFKTDALDDEAYCEYIVENGGFVTIPPTPTKDGAVFIKWKNGDSDFSFKQPITEDIVLVAEWEEIATVYTVDFLVDGNIVNTQKVVEGESVIAPTSVEVPVGKVLVGWENAENLQEVYSNMQVNAILEDKTYTVTIYGIDDIVLDEITVSHGQDAVLPDYTEYSVPYYTAVGYTLIPREVTCDLSTTVLYETEKFTVTFTLIGSRYDQKTVEYLDKVPLPANPVRAGYVFIGWYTVDDTLFDFNSQVVSSDLTLKAKFVVIEKTKYEVKFYNFDGSQYGGTQTVEEGMSAITPGKPYYEGYDFIGWVEDFSCITKNLDVHPIFAPKTYTVTFVDGDGVISTQTVKHGQNAIEPNASDIRIPEGKFFSGWSENFKKVSKDITVIAQFKPLTFVVMFYNGSKRVGATQYIAYGENATPPVLADKEGYDFLGWALEDEVGEFYTNIKQDLVLFAIYQIQKYDITYYEDGEIVQTANIAYGETAELYLYDKQDYIFAGWFTNPELTRPYDFSTIIKGDLELFAKWEEKPEITYTVQFMVDGEEYGKEQIVVENGNAIAPANPYKEGYTFIGWDGSYENITNNLVLNAVFDINMYVVTFVYCNAYGEEEIEVQEIPYGDPASEPNVYEKIGHKFDGWDTPFDKITKDIIVKAIYTPNTYTVTFYDGSEVISEQSVQYGKRPLIVSTPKKEGHEFIGWTLKHGDEFSFNWAVENDVEVYANWKKSTYTVYYYVDGALYLEQSVPYGDELPESPEPHLEYDEIFTGWSEKPFTMPAKPVVVVGYTQKLPRYVLSYYLNGTLYYSEELLEGESVTILSDPSLVENQVFSGWSYIPEFMPDGDVRIDGYITTIETRKNVIYIEVFDATDYSVGVSITVKGQVNFAGILGSLYFGDNQLTNTEFFGEGFASNYEDGVNFTWSQGENLTEEKTIAIMYFAKDGFNNLSIGLTVYEFLEITEDGNIQEVEFIVDYKLA